jgi:flagellar M-ring protein FliF
VLVADKVVPPVADKNGKVATVPPSVTPRSAEEIARIETLVRNALGVDSARGDLISVVSAPFDMPAPVVADSVPTPDLIARLQQNPKPLVAIASLVVLAIIALVTVSALKPKKGAAAAGAGSRTLAAGNGGYAELPASTGLQQALESARQNAQMQAELDQLQSQAQERRQVVLPPAPTTPEREQAIATVDQRPDAAVRVVRSWLRT